MSEVVTSDSLQGGDASVSVGQALASLRRERHLTGQQLGRRVGMSQAKISKIETGSVVPTPRDVERLTRALDVPAGQARQLVAQADASQNQMTDWRLRHGVGLAASQRELARVEATTRLFRFFHPAVIGGLLQTAEYARSLLSIIQRKRADPAGVSDEIAVAEGVSARIKRQEVLTDPGKKFSFLMTESVLHHLVCHPTEMVAQLHRIREASSRPNVTVAFIPSTVQLAYPPFHGFTLFDKRLVLVDVFNTFISSRGPDDVELYARVFDALREQAVTDIDEILDRYLQRYLDLSKKAH